MVFSSDFSVNTTPVVVWDNSSLSLRDQCMKIVWSSKCYTVFVQTQQTAWRSLRLKSVHISKCKPPTVPRKQGQRTCKDRADENIGVWTTLELPPSLSLSLLDNCCFVLTACAVIYLHRNWDSFPWGERCFSPQSVKKKERKSGIISCRQIVLLSYQQEKKNKLKSFLWKKVTNNKKSTAGWWMCSCNRSVDASCQYLSMRASFGLFGVLNAKVAGAGVATAALQGLQMSELWKGHMTFTFYDERSERRKRGWMRKEKEEMSKSEEKKIKICIQTSILNLCW